jgi:NTE family protein
MGEDSRMGSLQVIAVHSAPAGVGKTRFAMNLAASLARESGEEALLVEVAGASRDADPDHHRLGRPTPTIALNDASSLAGAPGLAARHAEGFHLLRLLTATQALPDENAISALIDALSRRFRHLVFDLPPRMDAAIWACLARASLRIVLTSPDPLHLDQTADLLGKLPAPVRVLAARVRDEDLDREAGIEARLGRPLDGLLVELPPEALFADPDRGDAAYSRVVRFEARRILGCLVGLALSSGAARGTAHIGVWRALTEARLAPDIIAGTSIGAIVGGLAALGLTTEAMTIAARSIRRRELFALGDLAIPPRISLLKGRRADAMLDRLFGRARFADLKIALRMIAVDLEASEEVVIARGSLRDGARASGSMPGIFPPALWEGRRLIDGAAMTPVPVEVLRREGIERVVAVNAMPTADSFRRLERHLLRTRTIDRGLGARLVAIGTGWVPRLVDTVLRAHQLMEAEIAEQGARHASVVIRPWLPEVHWLDFDSSPRFIEAGYRAASEAMPAIARLFAGDEVVR